MGETISTAKGLSIEYDEDIACDICRSVSTIQRFNSSKYIIGLRRFVSKFEVWFELYSLTVETFRHFGVG